MTIKRSFESISSVNSSLCKYSCKYETVDDIRKQFDKDDKIIPYLEYLRNHEDIFSKSDVCIVIDGVNFLYAENLKKKPAFEKLVHIVKLSSEDLDDDSYECIIV